MKNIFFILVSIIALAGFTACEDDNSPIFTSPSEEGVSFTNTFAAEYLIAEAIETNVAERFVWNTADFGAPINITYELQSSIDASFTEFDIAGSTSETDQAITVNLLLDYADDLGLDNDPTTTNPDGSPNNTGLVFFRLRAYDGAGTGNTEEMISDIQTLNITVIEETDPGAGCDSVWAVGDALSDIGWNFTDQGELTCESDVQQFKASFTNGIFRFFQTFGEWDTNNNYAYYESEGYTIDSNFANDGSDDGNFQFLGTPGIYVLTIDNVTKEITLEASGSLWAVGGATPGGWDFSGGETEMVQTSPGIYQATFDITNDIFRFFQTQGVWDTNNNYAYYDGEGYTIDPNLANNGENGDGDANFNFIGTPGNYTLTINDIDKTITLN